MTSANPVASETRQTIPLPTSADNPACPKCGGAMWDNRLSKRNAKAPDFKCRNRSCSGVVWPGRRVITPAIQASDVPRPQLENAERPNASAILREKYLDLTAFVLETIRPTYQSSGLTCGDETVAAITATLFIAETRREGL